MANITTGSKALERDEPQAASNSRSSSAVNALLHLRARYYSPMLQRFISEDPIGFDGGDANLYAYVGNDPVSLRDPLGLIAMPLPSSCGGDGRGKGLPPIARWLWCAPDGLAMQITLAAGGGPFAGAAAAGASDGPLAAAGRAIRQMASDISVDGPHCTEILGIRYRHLPVARLDYGPYPGTRGRPRLHLHINSVWPSWHIPIDPRSWWSR